MTGAVLRLDFDRDGIAVISRDLGRQTEVMRMTRDFSGKIAASSVDLKRDQGWLAAVFHCGELLPGGLAEDLKTRQNQIH
jgi:hypothetical protein